MIISEFHNHDFFVGKVAFQICKRCFECRQKSVIEGIIAQSDDIVIHAILLDERIIFHRSSGIAATLCMNDDLCLGAYFAAGSNGPLEHSREDIPVGRAVCLHFAYIPEHSIRYLIACLYQVGLCTVGH